MSVRKKRLYGIILVLVVALVGVSGYLIALTQHSRSIKGIEPWISVEGFKVTEELFCPGPLGYCISVDVTKPGETVEVQFYVWKKGRPALPWLVEFKLIQVDEEGNPLRVVDQETREIKKGYSTGPGWGWKTRVLYVAPAYYKFGVVIRNKEGGVLGKLISTLRVPKQGLNAKLSLNKREFRSGETLELTIHNEGPTTIFFGLYYTIEYLDEDGEWRPATWLYPSYLYDIAICLRPGKSYTQSIELFPALAGSYRISKEIDAEGTYLSTTLTETFTVTDSQNMRL